MVKLVLFNKPHGVLCQFRDSDGRSTLADFIDIPGVYAAGRLDRDSEGLLLLTDDGKLQNRITAPAKKTWKRYLVQVDGDISDDAVARLRSGVTLKDGKTRSAMVDKIDEPESLWPRDPPIRVRKNIPTSWIEISIREGKNRQIRRMTAAVGFPTLRLIRVQIGEWELGDLQPGKFSIETRGKR
ncbi:rRNA large subunit pseudouridine synthase E [Solemya elarraichensis gill symbiont]|uniref:Pseudouridine synthase n=1 Tax=Solemya elarraichensis gill symbiont TaxID=1918949 RepID=A0A1T2L300_9GAMM|nr:rRNA large subunit pseudouridine synthase E [Solemya elarraichensis gill symbiont]OOZ39459.1 23S rRNA pseudouridylate synthase [Solemya elarraichensis gill symbiont]